MKKIRNNKIKEKGFTLIEIVVVIAIIGIAFVPMLNFFINSIFHISEIETRSQAVSIAGDVIELIKIEADANWTYLDNFDSSSNSSDSTKKEAEILNNNIIPKYDLLANDIILSVNSEDFVVGDDSIQELTVKISWDSSNKYEEVITLIRNKEGGP